MGSSQELCLYLLYKSVQGLMPIVRIKEFCYGNLEAAPLEQWKCISLSVRSSGNVLYIIASHLLAVWEL